jgi:hypothetical protein
MTNRLAPLVLILLVAGCLGQGPQPSTGGPTSAPSPDCGDRCSIRTFGVPAGEVSVAINPTNPDHILAATIEGQYDLPLPYAAGQYLQHPGWAFLTVRVSLDGGRTWERVPIPYAGNAPATSGWSRFCVAADPVLLFAPDGRAHLFGLGWPCSQRLGSHPSLSAAPPPSYTSVGHIWMAASAPSEKGRLWSEPTIVHSSAGAVEWPDKEWAAIDPSTGALAVAWVGLGGPPDYKTSLRLATSSDAGRTWSAPRTVTTDLDDGNAFFAPMLVYGEDSRLHIVYRATCDNEFCIRVATSKDLTTWTRSTVGGFRSSTGQGNQTTQLTLPSLAFDASLKRLSAAWHSPTERGDADALISHSLDAGQTWSPPQPLHDIENQSLTDQFLPWIASDGRGGLHAFLYDRGPHPNTKHLVRAAYTRITPDNAIQTVAAGPHFNPDPASKDYVFFGDYQSAAAHQGRAVVAFAEWDPSRSGRYIHVSVFDDSNYNGATPT